MYVIEEMEMRTFEPIRKMRPTVKQSDGKRNPRVKARDMSRKAARRRKLSAQGR